MDGYSAFPAVEFAPGSLKAVGKNGAKVAAQQELTTAGPAAALKLTPIVGPKGLQADGEDVALIDVEVVDAKGQRCPTDDARVDFTCTGPGNLARRIQQRQGRLDQQPVPEHRVRDQSRCGAVDADGRERSR